MVSNVLFFLVCIPYMLVFVWGMAPDIKPKSTRMLGRYPALLFLCFSLSPSPCPLCTCSKSRTGRHSLGGSLAGRQGVLSLLLLFWTRSTSRTWKLEFRIIFTYPRILLFYSFQPFKNVETILRSGTLQKQVRGWIWPMGHSLPVSALDFMSYILCLSLPTFSGVLWLTIYVRTPYMQRHILIFLL